MNRAMLNTLSRLNEVESLDALYPQLNEVQFGPGWNKPTSSLWDEPKKHFQPHHWSYDTAKSALDAAGRLISTDLAERRNLILVNPAEGNTYPTAGTLVSAYQMIMPGEFARSHRHVPNALRLILDTEPGTYTIVDDERLAMSPGDVVLTPNWCWHGHGNDGVASGYWIDFLDVPLVQLLGPMFFEPLRKHDPDPRAASRSDLLFPWTETVSGLENAPGDPTGRADRQITFQTPTLDTFRLAMWRLAPGRKTQAFRTTANSIYAVVQGRGTTHVEEKSFAWSRGDVIVAPTWYGHWHEASEDAILFRVSDEEAMSRLGFLREEDL